MSYTVEIQSIKNVTHDVKQFTCQKPEGFTFEPGQATEVSVNKEGWKDEKRPFTFTSLNDDPHLQFTIKIYDDHDGVTKQIGKLSEGDEFIIDDPWGTIQYKGPGVFLAGGAGVTPFIAIFRDLYKKGEVNGNKLIFSNKTDRDIILEDEFEEILGDNFVNVITDEPTDEYVYLDGFIDKAYLEQQIDDFDQPFYVCGPMAFNEAMMDYLKELGASPDALIFEE
ncbi:FAD-binding oxidoreductase [Aliifodinibius sp. S!AR15-10]|uniref:FAD-binding oxidoreductase n=1 Tax=Aliifodinibius sp. S!AR15-10 TaxID=2950437 RepID=UPI002856883C|nr:FAD-binding oxidoreductase [Aliifodinibius sp. S!AR15-10]MDR8392965.1 FAD-binding oxidoreductase [Aliifodinibius sp. S!AR15-10]